VGTGWLHYQPAQQEGDVAVGSLPRPGEVAGSLQFLGLTVAALWALLSPYSGRNRLSCYLWLALFLTSLVPSPTDPQYFCLLVPFLVVEAMVALASLRAWRAWALLAVLALPYLILGARDSQAIHNHGEAVPGVWTQDRVPRWTIATVLTVAQKIDAAGQPMGATWWPGYFVSTRTPLIPTLANDFGFRAAPDCRPRSDAASALSPTTKWWT